jgi:NodT family efflux transporter outer membrane factor (OMF) lipoprotein
MKRKNRLNYLGITCISLLFVACKLPSAVQKRENIQLPNSYATSGDSLNSAQVNWKAFFTDPYLNQLIDSALKYNQELNITLEEIEITKNEIRARKGEYLPFLDLRAGAGVEKVARYTRPGAVEANNNIKPGKEFPEPLPDFMLGAYASWELDIWNKLHNAKKAAVSRYLATVEGKNFMVTNLVAELATSYYELMALDNQLAIIKRNIDIQTKALAVVKLQKQAAKVTELAVRKFEAEVLKNRSRQYYIQQEITETENRINFLLGRYPQHIQRNSDSFTDLVPDIVYAGLPVQLLENRPDVKQAELELAASRLDVKAAKANFYPSLGINAGVGLQAFDASELLKTPESMLYSLAGDLVAPLINRNAIKATYYNANAKQIQAVYNYERTVLQAYIETLNQLSKIANLKKSYDLQEQQVQALNRSINISSGLFQSARADYMEVLLTQRDALESKIELIETKKEQMMALVKMYQALGGGWQ